ncbi:MAG: Transcriptional regulator PadR-like family protein [Methanosaeta sp. PtaU1.Bin112]|nr:MAG: Transcriptional regulator PadR-like family protein [Methanosaeta sp. PtaU1.Bin112]
MIMLHIMKDGEASGYDIIKKVEAISGKKPSTGAVYPLLKKMQREGWISGRVEDGKTYYRLTDIGREHVAQINDVKREFIQKLHRSMALASETFEDCDVQDLMKDMHDLHRGLRVPVKEQMQLLSPLIHQVADLLEIDTDREKIRSVILKAVDELKRL